MAYCELCFYEMTKSQQDQKERGDILTKMKPRAGERDTEFKFTLTQMHTKFKKCMSECKNVAQQRPSQYELPQ